MQGKTNIPAMATDEIIEEFLDFFNCRNQARASTMGCVPDILKSNKPMVAIKMLNQIALDACERGYILVDELEQAYKKLAGKP